MGIGDIYADKDEREARNEAQDRGVCTAFRSSVGAKQIVDDLRDRAWILTFTGKQFFHLRPTPEMVCIEDVAHALSNIGRWTGHTKYFYSVAQHSWYCSTIVEKQFALQALLHDASEAYLGDMNRPLKHCTAAGPAYIEIESKVEEVIFKKFGLTYPFPPEVKVADNLMLYAERAQLMNAANVTYEFRKWGVPEDQADVTIQRWTPKRAEKMFLRRYKQLTQGVFHNANSR